MEVDSEEKKTVPEIIIDSTERYQMPPFKFNITDGGFTELHAIWSAEEETKEFDYDIWNRRHDYWLMCGFAVHGYLRYNEVLNDPRFALLNEPFKQEQNKANLQEIKHRFLQRQQLRRAVNLQYGQKKLENEVEKNGTDEAKQNGNESESKEVEMIEEQSTSAAKETPKLDTEKVQTKPARIEALVHANKQVAQEAFAGNRQAGVALQKMLSQLEEILSDMKSDVSRLPATVAHLPSVCQRLEMDERAILNRLTSRDPEAVAGQSSLPSPGPFVTPLMQARFNGIQPKFAAVVNPKRDIQTPSHGAPIVIPLDTDVQKTNDPETAKEVKSADVKPEKLDVGDDVKPEKLDATDDVKLEEVDVGDVVKMEEVDASDDVGDVVKMEELDASDDIKPEKLDIEEIPQASKSPDIEELPQTSKSPDIEEIPQTSKSSEPAKSPEPEQLPDLDNSAMETDN
ncbi:DUF1086 domain-containing protein [Aphelenchoides bicaudatus]|nr:DUF1086 domain-containing protein [Aphelenchoides bicaudatus]